MGAFLTIYEAWVEGCWLQACDAGVVLWIEEVSVESMTRALRDGLAPDAAAARATRLSDLIGVGGRQGAVDTVLRVIEEKVRPGSVL